MTFSSLCEYLSASPVRQISILKDQKYPKTSIVKSYSSAIQQIQSLAVDKRPLNPQATGIEPHEQEVLEELLNNSWSFPSQRASRPATKMNPMKVKGVEISVFPDLLLSDKSGKVSGSLKFYMSKSKELDAEVARWMASFLYCYKCEVEKDTSAHPNLCMIYNARTDEYFEAGKSYKRLFQNIEGACQFIGALWPVI